MDSFIILRRNNKNVKVQVLSGEINEETLRRAFLLESDVPVSLYKDDLMLASNNCVFKLGDEWSGQTYLVEWEEQRRSRPSSRIGEDSPIPCKKAKILVENNVRAKDMEWFTSLHSFALYYEGADFVKRCVTPISTQIVSTYAHGSHKNLTVDSTKENPILIRNYYDNNYCIPAKVVKRNDGMDVVILQAVSKEFFSKRPVIDAPEVGMRYMMLGLSNIENEKNNLSLGCGSVMAKFDDELRYVGSSGSANEDSGAGVWNSDKKLIGMNILVKHVPVKLSERSRRQYTHAIGGSTVFVAASAIKLFASEYIPRTLPIAFEE